jgi:cytochrome P450
MLSHLIRTFEAGGPTGRTSLIDVTYRDSKLSHDAMENALKAYFTANHDVSDSTSDESLVAAFTVDIAAIQREYGFSAREIAATHVTIVHGALVNTVPTLFWCVAYVFSRPVLLSRLRDELITALSIDQEEVAKGDMTPKSIVVDADTIENPCPLLLSVVRETQRLVATGTLHRRVLEDTTVTSIHDDGQEQTYILKKGTSILLPVALHHRNPLIWGAEADEFDESQFLEPQPYQTETEHQTKSLEQEVNSFTHLRKLAYVPFGGGREFCPERYFAITEIMGTMTMLIMGYDIKRPDGRPVKQPRFGLSKMTAATARPHPDADLEVRIKQRDGWGDVLWKVKDPN